MQIVLSFEEIVLFSFLLNAGTLFIVNELLFCAATKRRILLGALIGTILESVCLCYLALSSEKVIARNIFLLFMAIGSSWIATLIAFRTNGFWGEVQVLMKGLLVSSLIGALFTMINGVVAWKRRFGIPLLLLICGMNYAGVRIYEQQIRKRKNFCKVYIVGSDDNRISFYGLLDTGNRLKEPISQKPVCVVNEACFKQIVTKETMNRFRVIPYRTVDREEGIMYGIPVKYIEIELSGVLKRTREVYLATTKEWDCEGVCDILLPYNIIDGGN